MSDASTATEAGSGEDKASKHPRRAPGIGFPALPLGEAVTLIKKVASYGNSHTDAAVASFLGHSTSNSGPFRSKVAAMRDYGLIAGRGGELTVTPLALEIVHPGLDANPLASLRAAFMTCKPFTALYDALPKGVDLEVASLANTAMHNHGVSSQSKDAFAVSFVKGGILAGLMEEVDGGHVRISAEEPSSGSGATDEIGHDETPPPHEEVVDRSRRVVNARVLAPESTNAVVSHSWPIDGGVVRFTIESSKTLPANAYGVIGSVIEAGDKLAVMLAATVTELHSGESTDPE